MKNFSKKIEIFQKLMYKNAIKMLGRAIFERFYQIFGVFIPKNMVFFGFQSGVFFGVLRFPFGVFGPKLSGHTARLELDQCLVNWPRPAGLIIKKFWAVGPWTQLPRSGRTEVRIADCVEYRIDASQNFVHQCLSKIVKDPRLTFHKDLGGRAHTHLFWT